MTRKMLHTLASAAYLCLLVLVLTTPVQAQLGAASALFQTFDIDPRSQSLGNAMVALRGYSGAERFNPATIGRAHTIQLGSTIDGGIGFKTRWLPNIFSTAWLMSPSIDYKRNRWAIGYNYRRLSFGNQEIRDAQNNPIRTVNIFDHSHKLTAALDINEALTVGLGLNIIKLANGISVDGSTIQGKRTFSIDMGVYYARRFEMLSYYVVQASAGWSLTDFGRRIRFDSPFSDITRRSALPMMMRGGLGLTIETKAQWIGLPILSLGLYGSLAKPMVYFDDKTTESVGPFRTLFNDGWKPFRFRSTAVESPEPVEFTVWDQTTRHGGIEFAVLNAAFVRWGRFHEHEMLGNRQYNSFGFGLDLYYIVFDYAKNRDSDDNIFNGDDPSPYSGMKYWKITARVPLGQTTENFWDKLIR